MVTSIAVGAPSGANILPVNPSNRGPPFVEPSHSTSIPDAKPPPHNDSALSITYKSYFRAVSCALMNMLPFPWRARQPRCVLLGRQYDFANPEDHEAFLVDFGSRVLFTYRHGFRPLPRAASSVSVSTPHQSAEGEVADRAASQTEGRGDAGNSSDSTRGRVAKPSALSAATVNRKLSVLFRGRQSRGPLAGGAEAEGLTSDGGWGCMIRVFQMSVAQACMKIMLGRAWRRPRSRHVLAVRAPKQFTELGSPQRIRGRNEDWLDSFNPQSVYPWNLVPLLTHFRDHPAARFSLHRIVLAGRCLLGIQPGEWFGPTSCSQSMALLVNGADLRLFTIGAHALLLQGADLEAEANHSGALLVSRAGHHGHANVTVGAYHSDNGEIRVPEVHQLLKHGGNSSPTAGFEHPLPATPPLQTATQAVAEDGVSKHSDSQLAPRAVAATPSGVPWRISLRGAHSCPLLDRLASPQKLVRSNGDIGFDPTDPFESPCAAEQSPRIDDNGAKCRNESPSNDSAGKTALKVPTQQEKGLGVFGALEAPMLRDPSGEASASSGGLPDFSSPSVPATRRVDQLVVYCSLRLGLDSFNLKYQGFLQSCFGIPQFQGLAGGGPLTSAYWFVAANDENLYFLDPHSPVQPALISIDQELEVQPERVQLEGGLMATGQDASSPDEDFSETAGSSAACTAVACLSINEQPMSKDDVDHMFFASVPKQLPWRALNPSMTLVFLCSSIADFDDLIARLKEVDEEGILTIHSTGFPGAACNGSSGGALYRLAAAGSVQSEEGFLVL